MSCVHDTKVNVQKFNKTKLKFLKTYFEVETQKNKISKQMNDDDNLTI